MNINHCSRLQPAFFYVQLTCFALSVCVGDLCRRSMAERDGRPKLSLRRFFSSIGLHSVGRLVKGGRSSSMEQLSISAPRASSASPSPTHSPHTNTRLQRTPSLQALHSVSTSYSLQLSRLLLFNLVQFSSVTFIYIQFDSVLLNVFTNLFVKEQKCICHFTFTPFFNIFILRCDFHC